MIKFRAWDKHEQKMYDNSQIVIWNGNAYQHEYQKIFDRLISGKKGLVGRSLHDDYLMQSTGLFDRSEPPKEIFEGDIVKATRFHGRSDYAGGFYEYEKDYVGVVKQLEGCLVIDTGNDAVDLWTEIDENIVLGNIYENPDLLESVE